MPPGLHALLGLGLALCALTATAAAPTGAQRCQPCHADAVRAWQGTHHAQAMQPATPATVLGDFNGVRFEHQGQVTEFQRRQGRYEVRTAGADGQPHTYPVTHTIGVYPLQQLLLAVPGGRLQALGVAWDARPREQGGQRWYTLNPEAPPQPGEPTHWSGRDQTWNFMCARCHTTGLRKHYNAATDRYQTTQDELGVGCEACHGSATGHLAWARSGPRTARPAGLGFAQPVASLRPLQFLFEPDIARPLTLRIAQPQGLAPAGQAASEVCLPCHARRSELQAPPDPRAPWLDQVLPSLLAPGLYQPDGRIDGEVFEAGSFLQSAMHRAGVGCANCHEAHTLKLRAEGNALCSQCHLSRHYDSASHPQAGHDPSATCVGCHMPTRTYMGVHARHDHGLSVPPAAGAANAVAQEFSAAWQAATTGRNATPPLRAALAASQSNFVRASAMALPNPAALPALAQAVRDPSDLLRLGAARGLAHLPARDALALGLPLLSDARRAVRTEAARSLLPVPAALWPVGATATREAAVQELIATEQAAADRPESWLNLGQIHALRGHPQQAEQALRQAIRLAPDFAPAYVNLADLYRQWQREADGETLLREAVVRAPQQAGPAHALGLLLVRQGRLPESLPWLAQAQKLSPERLDYALVRVLALMQAGQSAAAKDLLAPLLRRHPDEASLQRTARSLGLTAGP